MKVKIINAYDTKRLQEKIDSFFYALNRDKGTYQIVNYQLIHGESEYVATFMYFQKEEQDAG